MEIDNEKACRICGDEGIHNIFETDMKVSEKNLKMYIILNNFMYDKLYGPDEHSSLICESCCDSLLTSYLFMMQVRESERILKTDGHLPPKKKLKLNTAEKAEDIKSQNNKIINNESLFEEDFIEEYEEEEPNIQQQSEMDETVETSDSQLLSTSSFTSTVKLETKSSESRPLLQLVLLNEVAKRRRSQDKVQDKSTEDVNKFSHKEAITTHSIVISDYKLVAKNNTDQKTVTILFLTRLINMKPEEDYTFEEYYELINNQNNQIYSCSYCVKAFGTCELLIKHISSCHTCLLCFKIFHNGYKELSQHMKTHATEKFQCPLCLKLFSQQLYRQHIKKNHFPNIPFFVAVRPNCHSKFEL